MMKVFITGANGFLGSFLRKSLKGYEITAPTSSECNLYLDESLIQFATTKFDLIIHLAAWTQAGDFCLKHPGEQWINNQRINTNILDWWKSCQPQAKLIFIGTSCVYAPDEELIEDNYMVGEPIESLYTYAMTKRMLLQGAKALEKQFNLNWLCLVPSTLYGENYHNDGRQMHFIFDLVRKIIRGKELGEKVVLWGDGYQRREIVHVADFVKRMVYLMENENRKIINIGAGFDLSIRRFAEIISETVGFDSRKIVYDKERYVGTKSKKLSVEKLLTIYPNHLNELIEIEVGIKSVVDWFYKENAYL